MTTPSDDDSPLYQRVLAITGLVLIAVGFIAVIAILIGTAAGLGSSGGFGESPWPVVVNVPVFAMPIGFLCITALLITNYVKLRREKKR